MTHQSYIPRVKGSVMQGCLPILAKALGEDHGLKVEIGGSGACINHETNTIHLPLLPYEDPEVAILAYGYMIHEIGHKKFTDFTQKGGITTATHNALYQIIEDVREEKLTGKELPGGKIRLGQLVEKMVKDGGFAKPTPDCHPAHLLQGYMLYRLRHEYLGQEGVAEYALEAEEIFRETVSPGVAAKVGALIARVPSLTCTKDSVDLSQQILTVLEEALEEPPEQDESQQPQPVPTSAEGDSASSNGGSPDNSDGKQDQDSGGDGSDPSSESTENESATSEQQDATNGLSEDAKQAIKEMLEAKEQDLEQDLGEKVAEQLTTEAEEAVRQQGGSAGMGYSDQPPTGVSDPSELLHEVKTSTNALRVKMSRKLQSFERKRKVTRANGKRLRLNRIHRVAFGDPNVFEKRMIKKALNTDVVVLLDSSGSMKHHQMEVALQSSLSIGLSLDNFDKVRIAVGAFPGYNSPVQTITDMHESVLRTANRYPCITSGGGTPMGEALLWAYYKLYPEPGNRKIVIVVTDGAPASPKSVTRLIDVGRRSGIEVYGLGIATNYGEDIFPHWQAIYNLGELPTVLFSLLDQNLLAAA